MCWCHVIESILFFTLGFLCAGFLALLVAPAFLRRAVRLTRRRIEASVPLTLDEIRADKDRLRAEHAMAVRRLEIAVKDLRERAAGQVVEINRLNEKMKALVAEDGAKQGRIGQLESERRSLQESLAAREGELARQGVELAETRAALREAGEELRRLDELYEEASLNTSSLQIELVAREAEVDKLAGDVSALRNQRKEAEKRVREIGAENKGLVQSLRQEKRKVLDLEQKLAGDMTAISNLEERLERREREIARLRGKDQGQPDQEHGHGDDAALREEIQVLAAQIVSMTARLEGPDSPIPALLGEAASTPEERPTSLADRIRALQQAARSS